MILENISKFDLFFKIPAITSIAPLSFMLNQFLKNNKKLFPSPYGLISLTITGLSTAFVITYYDSQNRLQGYSENSEDIKYWEKKLEYEKAIADGKVEETRGFLSSLFGPKQFNRREVEKNYLDDK
jgi:hypothetical protein